MNTRKIALIIFFVIMATLLLTACGDDKSELTGKWEGVSVVGMMLVEPWSKEIHGEIYLELFSDGIGAFLHGISVIPFNWTAERGRFMITMDKAAYIWDYDISNADLELTEQRGDDTLISIFRRTD